MRPESLIQPVRIGIVDSGHSPAQQRRVVASRRFLLVEQGLAEDEVLEDEFGHGSAIIDAICRHAPEAEFCVAQVFDKRGVTSAMQISSAIDWLAEHEVRLINLSLGMRQDRSLLREACAAALKRGVLLCASSPAQGEAVFPASYPGVVRVTGDARCGEQDWSWLNSAQADFAACVRGTLAGQSGASLGCAALSGHIAAYMTEQPNASNSEIIDWLRAHARYRGPERRAGP